MTNIRSPLGNFGSKSSNKQPQPKKTYFVSDEPDKSFEIPELDYPQQQTSQSQSKLQPQQRIDFSSAEEFNQWREGYLSTGKKKQESIQEELKQNIEVLLGLGVRDKKVIIDDFGFRLRSLGDKEKEEIEKELIILRQETMKECQGITEKELELIILKNRARRILAKAIVSVFKIQDGKEIEAQSFDDFLGTSEYEYKLEVTSNFQEPLRDVLLHVFSEIDREAPKNFPTIESLAKEIKK